MTDQFKDFLVYDDALIVKKINEHNAGAVAARYWDDAIDISPSGTAAVILVAKGYAALTRAETGATGRRTTA
jgi:hypothetical protein